MHVYPVESMRETRMKAQMHGTILLIRMNSSVTRFSAPVVSVQIR
jgi:hypothetical protein